MGRGVLRRRLHAQQHQQARLQAEAAARAAAVANAAVAKVQAERARKEAEARLAALRASENMETNRLQHMAHLPVSAALHCTVSLTCPGWRRTAEYNDLGSSFPLWGLSCSQSKAVLDSSQCF
jgi:sRNA-binding protein